ncbi:TraR/DksA C4-type zinc finger protein [Aestuariibacter halophilus]|uniref:TraR/DksA C4-type zinc finger protein n=1 Tax=Fluctibacter halophilus TaxID=226011 RepID=A0ABS8G9F6_9ALTE|nr:TraR/DksA C4-type zinc finger protein [Aestuariibacter halophilus]MCC2617138.1 TraR/DksA C4-type zinc finger protein [Aestuariibacter halophilus]
MQVAKFKEKLESQRQILQTRLQGIKEDFAQGQRNNSSDGAMRSENDEVLKQLEYEAQEEIRAINQALQRIERGEFGICEDCGKDISPARLNIVPTAQQCRDCAD